MGVPKKNAKATKKFEKNHLKGTLDKRKAQVKIKQRVIAKQKKQSKRSQDDEFYKGAAAATGANAGKTGPVKKRPDATVSEMSVDDFFSGGFQIIDDKKAAAKVGKDKDTAQLGKRKRNGAAKKGEDESDDESDASEPEPVLDSEDEDDIDVDDVGMTKEAMDALAEKDPEFYKFLKENDPGALDFDEDADLAEIDDLSAGSDSEGDDDDDDDDDEGRPKKKQKKSKKAKAAAATREARDNELTRPMIAKWEKSMAESFSLRAARQTVLAFRCAAHLNEDPDEEASLSQRYAIKSPDVFHDILVVALKHIPLVLQHHVPVKESSTHRVYVQTDGKKFKTLGVLVRSFASSVLHLLTTLSDDGTMKLTLSALTPLLPYLLSFRKVLKQLVKSVVHFWAQPASSETTRITAFLVLRRLMVIGDKGVREAVLKAVYQGLVQGSRSTNANTLAGINLMKNSAAELWGLDAAIGYTTAFTSIRQLAIHLRNSIVHNQNNAFRNVYNWQYVHSLDFWSCVLAEHCTQESPTSEQDKAQLKLLVYPLVQVTLGAMRLIPTAAYFPLRFQLFRSLLRVSRATGTYIPLAPILIEVLNSADMKKPGKANVSATADKQLDFTVAYKAPKSMLHTGLYQTAVGEQVVELLSEYFALWSTSIAFPEFALPVIIMLKRWIKDARKRGGRNGKNVNSKVVGGLVLVVQKLEANATFIETKRSQVTFAPRDRTQVDAFLKDYDWQKTPVGAFVVAQRKASAERQRALEETRKAEDSKRQEDKQKLQAKDGSAAVFFGFAEAAEHVAVGPVGTPLWVLIKQRLGHGRDNVARRDGVDADAVLAPLRRQVAAELQHRRLGRIVCRADEAAVRDSAAHARNEGHAARRRLAAAETQHLARDSLRRKEDARDVCGHHAVKVDARVLERRRLLLDAGSRYEPVEAAVLVGNLGNQLVERLLFAHVDAVVCEGRALLLGLVGHAGKVGRRLRQPVEGVHAGTGIQQSLGLHETDTARTARHDDDLALKAELGQARHRPAHGERGARHGTQ
ncbi:ribosome assembly protein [Ophiostoma piceae UAMH 11346]|uniref:Ribosome assembly protein n=1 Tax=Ophiostoma piceae (strain UAMH 11346) TaxID=1262450 RepID=S3BVJ7_OPHP1|nr:ribosome assembly protein [Ophiostoma piceae UAMH 11346]